MKRTKEIIIDNIKYIVKKYFITETGSNVELTEYQEKFIKEILKREKRKYIFLASTRAGKTEATAVAATLSALFYDAETVVVIAPTFKQSMILFRRIQNYFLSNKRMYEMLDRENTRMGDIRLKNLSRIMTLSAGNPEGLLGFSATMLIIDEAGSIPEDVIKTRVLRMITSARGNPPILVMLGTPHQKNYLWEAWNDPAFYKIRVTWKDAVKEGQMNEEEVMFMKERLPEPVFRVWYEAEFPEEDEDAIFKTVWINKAYEEYEKHKDKEIDTYRIGVDVARFGNDLTVITVLGYNEKDDLWIMKDIEVITKSDLMNVVGRVKNMYEKYKDKVSEINVDEIGIGAGVLDRLKELGLPAYGFNAGAKPPRDTDKYENMKSFWTYELRNAFEEGKIIIMPRKELIDELLKIKYEFSSTGRLRIVDPKDKSPDYFDSLLIAFANVKMSGSRILLPEKGMDTRVSGGLPWMY